MLLPGRFARAQLQQQHVALPALIALDPVADALAQLKARRMPVIVAPGVD